MGPAAATVVIICICGVATTSFATFLSGHNGRGIYVPVATSTSTQETGRYLELRKDDGVFEVGGR